MRNFPLSQSHTLALYERQRQEVFVYDMSEVLAPKAAKFTPTGNIAQG